MGRVNFGEKLVGERKGITQSGSFGDKELTDWQMWSLPPATFPDSSSSPAAARKRGPAFWQGSFVTASMFGDS